MKKLSSKRRVKSKPPGRDGPKSFRPIGGYEELSMIRQFGVARLK